MSKGPWKLCPWIGISMATLERSEPEVLTDDGEFDRDLLLDCDLFDIRSIAAAAGCRNFAYFRDVILTDPSSPFHMRRIVLRDSKTARREGDIFATHTDSAGWGGDQWRARQRQAARERALEPISKVLFDVSGKQAIYNGNTLETLATETDVGGLETNTNSGDSLA